MMNPANPNPRTIFCEAVDYAAGAERAAFLDRACGGDAALRARVEALLEADARAGKFLEGAPAAAVAPTVTGPHNAEPLGTMIGPYKLLQQIGEGGMGVVYMAEQMHPVQRRVALKLIRPGLDSRAIIARIEAERQALAMMEHPNIAKVPDAGTTDEMRNAE
jgi:serine/threonine protein kinase